MRTGDLAIMADDDYLRIVGRSKDMVIRGGENVYPPEIEESLRGHPALADAPVFGVPDPGFGEEIMAWIGAAPGGGARREGDRRVSAAGGSRTSRSHATSAPWMSSR